jgi:hypothetical protein
MTELVIAMAFERRRRRCSNASRRVSVAMARLRPVQCPTR